MAKTVIRFRWVSVLLFVVFSMNGCVYLRLLKVQKQFQHFSRYVRLDTSFGIALTFLQPELLERDVIWLLKGEPAIQARSGRHALFKYEFPKTEMSLEIEDAAIVHIALALLFEDGKLVKVRIPREFSNVIQPELLERSLQSMGAGPVNKRQRSVAGTVASARQDDEALMIPTRDEIERILGLPHAKITTSDDITLYYQYEIRLKSLEAEADPPLLKVWFSFLAEENARLHKARVTFNHLTASINFS